jgi:hypothetical protein
MFDIEITYETGDSLHLGKDTQMLCLPVSNIELAKDNLQRIKQHYEIYQKRRSYSVTPQKIDYPSFYITHTKIGTVNAEIDGIILETDNGKHNMISPFWIGYFERLITARIVADDDEISFTVGS